MSWFTVIWQLKYAKQTQMHGYCTAKLFRIQIQLNINRLQDLEDLCGHYNTEKLFDILLQIVQLVPVEDTKFLMSTLCMISLQHNGQVHRPTGHEENPPRLQQMMKMVPAVTYFPCASVKCSNSCT